VSIYSIQEHYKVQQMATLTAYPTNTIPKASDLLLGTKIPTPGTTEEPITNNVSISSLASLINTGFDGGYKVYTALITQTGTDAPVATVLQNTTGGTIAWSYSNVGIYVATISDATYTANKTAVLISSGGVSNSTVKSSVVNSTTALTVYQVDVGDQQPTNTISATTTLEIRIYS